MVQNSYNSRARQPRCARQQDFGGSSQHEYYPSMPGYYPPQYGYHYHPQYQQLATEDNVPHPRMYGAQNGRRGGKNQHGSHPVPSTPKERLCRGHAADKEHQKGDGLANRAIHLADRIRVREEVVIACLEAEVWNLRDLLVKAESNAEKDAVATALVCLGGAIEIMEDALNYDEEQLHELDHPGEADEEIGGCDDHYILDMLQEELFPSCEGYLGATTRKGKAPKGCGIPYQREI
ncbi:hypothetical protein SLS55_009914 [Diplodia seriata]|uniref:Uncharacterized protein n=1 Tax=Diplodia seriata TaxID=420778 RepID=A0ABR3C4K6_9PEZI